ncbi:MAG: cupin domain-containing protein [Planctomycetaceae bacterium]
MIERLLDPALLPTFINEHYQKLPFALAGGAKDFVPLAGWDTIEAVLSKPNVDWLTVRKGEKVESRAPRSQQDVKRLLNDGVTLVIRHAERHADSLAQLAESFRDDFGGDVDVHIYCTPADGFGFGWHYDAEEVFIIQTAGTKTYSLRKNTVNPWPVAETLPADMHYGAEIMPLLRCRLQAGDWLYIPSGYWHKGDAEHEAVSMAVGVKPLSGVDVFDFLRKEVLESLRWRQRLPILGRAAKYQDLSVEDRCHELFSELASDLSQMFADGSLVGRFLEEFGDDRRRKIGEVGSLTSSR